MSALPASLLAAWNSFPGELPPLENLVRDFPLGESALIHYLNYSRVGLSRLIADPPALVWLADPAVTNQPLGPGRLLSELAALNGDAEGAFDSAFSALRRTKGRQMLRIALRDMAKAASLEETTRELSDLATFCLDQVTRFWLSELSRRFGSPSTGFAVLGMGKLGGRELNFSSDIDVIFVYGEEGDVNPHLTNHEFFARLAQSISKTFSESSAFGPLFRIDLRLRPEGSTGPIVRSVESMENYYAAMGETWERMALIKARCVCGDAEVGYELLQRLQPFIFPRHIAADTLEEIGMIKGRIERELLDNQSLRLNVKLGRGGIREIEFIVQSFQLLQGARNAFLQEQNTLKTLALLSRLQMVEDADAAALASAYRFLRCVEHRLQIQDEAQTHLLPQSSEQLAVLASSLGFKSAADFCAELDAHRERVRELFERFIHTEPCTRDAPRNLAAFSDPDQARRQFEAMAGDSASGTHHAPRTRRVYANLEPLLLDRLAQCADPDRALSAFSNFVSAYGARSLLFETLTASPRVLDLLLRLFDSSPFLTRVVLRRPQLIEEITRGRNLARQLSEGEFLEGFRKPEERLEPLEWARVYRRSQILRIALRDILGFATVEEVCAEYSALAGAALTFCAEHLGAAPDLGVVAMGKFGGAELAYGADLDIIFVSEDTAVSASTAASAVRLTKAMGLATEEGFLFKLDPRLRPEGDASPLVVSLDAVKTYYASPRAQPWEFQALSKARGIFGRAAHCFLNVTAQPWREAGQRPDFYTAVHEMILRVQKERAAASGVDLKSGRGGIMTVEFVTQALQMRLGIREPNTCRALSLLGPEVITPKDAHLLKENYLYLRRVESVLRRENNESVSVVPEKSSEQQKLAVRCGEASREVLLDKLAKVMEENQSLARYLLGQGD